MAKALIERTGTSKWEVLWSRSFSFDCLLWIFVGRAGWVGLNRRRRSGRNRSDWRDCVRAPCMGPTQLAGCLRMCLVQASGCCAATRAVSASNGRRAALWGPRRRRRPPPPLVPASAGRQPTGAALPLRRARLPVARQCASPTSSLPRPPATGRGWAAQRGRRRMRSLPPVRARDSRAGCRHAPTAWTMSRVWRAWRRQKALWWRQQRCQRRCSDCSRVCRWRWQWRCHRCSVAGRPCIGRRHRRCRCRLAGRHRLGERFSARRVVCRNDGCEGMDLMPRGATDWHW